MTHVLSRYEIAKEFTAGYVAALIPATKELTESNHWLAGYDAGYRAREAKNAAINEYLGSIGLKPMAMITTQ
jgi:hypothetical protein